MSQEVAAVHEAAQAVESTGGLSTLGINLKIFLAQLVNFLVVLWVLRKWAYTPIIKILEGRSKKIAKSMKDAEKIEKRLLDLENERKTILSQARDQAVKMAEETKNEVDQRREEMIKKAKDDVIAIVNSGKKQLQLEKELMLREAKKEMIEVSILAAKKILEKNIDEKSAKVLADEVIKKMA